MSYLKMGELGEKSDPEETQWRSFRVQTYLYLFFFYFFYFPDSDYTESTSFVVQIENSVFI